ncbi:hypothetical protein [Deinococcus radiodurans]|jgi:hypothetical protein|uniref:hypothetical protein n=1 Tax=Deinococcus radiodurans TaxID=1299 RepID=UPI00047F14DC|nr:hypothetical protein [Deinococcus radiodurans]ANC71745.1 hypothetical protein A2G07_08160 [Deinococcus radiodurans R1 = ATCC 13939 = DSM 20539]QEM70556.1 hypothetical protein DXG80_01485 [Deinococcus radiodurans]QIP29163.1 hypothetical protein HAV23_08290 [Deinococcus radiodurans]QIP32141.1 hypothetical protein HAV35_08505 [Deinococcus radiodurans]UDL00208.1 hypothetical protein E5E91_05580 [Deinococcus radiodurans R1 = ATCC 13939 = DSM 20539]
MTTLLLIVGLSVLLLGLMLLSRPKRPPQETQPLAPRRVRWLDPAVQAVFDRSSGKTTPVRRGQRVVWEPRVLLKLRGDRAEMERLILQQTDLFPRASREQLLKIIYDTRLRNRNL